MLQLHVAGEQLNYQCFEAFLHDRNDKIRSPNSKAMTASQFSKSPGMPQLDK